ncbi:MAG: hypothetical protein M5U34_12255 [Chloroflexi bacterium]|nr:hypothetical protein [Chloroflexota bacterium]
MALQLSSVTGGASTSSATGGASTSSATEGASTSSATGGEISCQPGNPQSAIRNPQSAILLSTSLAISGS